MKHSFLTIFLLLYAIFLKGENLPEIKFNLIPIYGNKIVSLKDQIFSVNSKDSLKIETVKFYLTSIQLLNEKKIIYSENNSFHLIDLSIPSSLSFSLPFETSSTFDEINFNLGIDSLTNSGGAQGGDLDPTKGMYWTWQSGYINFKIEGTSLRCNTRNHEFNFHLGGFAFPFNAIQKINLSISTTKVINVEFDLKYFLDNVNLEKQNHIMSPSSDAIQLTKIVAQCFHIN